MPIVPPRRMAVRAAALAIRWPRARGWARRCLRRGLAATRAAVRRTTWGLAAAGVRRTAAVRRTVLAMRGSARMAVGPPLRTNVRAARVTVRTAARRAGRDIVAPRGPIILRAAIPATMGMARRCLTATSANASRASSSAWGSRRPAIQLHAQRAEHMGVEYGLG